MYTLYRLNMVKQKMRFSYVWSFILCFVFYQSKADTLDHFKVSGFVMQGDSMYLSHTLITVLNENGEAVSINKSDENGTFSLDLIENKVYTVRFEKDKYIRKNIVIHTTMLSKHTQHKDHKLSFNCHLVPMPQNPDIHKLKDLEQPFAVLIYNESKKNFTWDKEYTQKMENLEKELTK